MSKSWNKPQGRLPHFVYRLFDEGDQCLYVGCTRLVKQRLVAHHKRPWGPTIARVEITEHPDWRAAAQVEADEIRTLHPRWNIHGRTSWHTPGRLSQTDHTEVLMSLLVNAGDKVMSRKTIRGLNTKAEDFAREYPDTAAVVLPALGFPLLENGAVA